MSPLISIVIVNYNRENYLGEAIASVLAQTWQDFELLIWDDGSTDESVAIANKYAQQDKRVRVVEAPHLGIAAAIKAAIAQTSGTYIGLVDSDDILAPTALAETAAVLNRHPKTGFVYTDYLNIDQEGNTVLNPGDILVPGETLNYTSSSNATGAINAFTVRASDRVSSSAPQQVGLNIAQTPPPPPTPPDDPIATPSPCTFQCDNNPVKRDNRVTISTIPTDTNRALLDTNPTPEDKFTSSIATYLGIPIPNLKTLDEGKEIAQRIEKATGVKPAFVYISFVPVEVTPEASLR
jgi:hypothetical protein